MPDRPPVLDGRDDRWAVAERLAFEGADADVLVAAAPDVRGLVRSLLDLRHDVPLGPSQLVHGDLAGNVLLDAAGAPVVIDVAPYWRPSGWAEAVAVLDAVLWSGADPRAVAGWAAGTHGQLMVRAALFRVLSDDPCDVGAYRRVLAPVLARGPAVG